jgi:hypothetical protein
MTIFQKTLAQIKSTNVFLWCFLKLENQKLYIDPNYIPLTFTEPHRVLGVLQWILDESLKPYQS